MHYRRIKYKSQPIRNTNKSPQLQDLRHSLNRAVADGVVLPVEVRKRIGSQFETANKPWRETYRYDRREPVRYASFGGGPSVRTGRRMDEFMFEGGPTLNELSSEIAEFTELDTANPVTGTNGGHIDSSCFLTDQDEHLMDIIQEASAAFLSNWFLSAAKCQEFKASRSAVEYISESILPPPVPVTPTSSARLSGTNSPNVRQSKRRTPRVFLPLSKVKKISAKRSLVRKTLQSKTRSEDDANVEKL
jgi:hypothetical protein